ncbi:hypothetical protein O181_036362 [Austropuccinia psidii MF-1]|uniref:Uncharacterized protein n=1 Tax=Austropuccinia psidii MF-1 TaxID=1389203 RepID=A0A9Q3H9V5_9BASI|nr:hypothetical protein [Austropuccinia psidii MF-1]
MKATIQYNQMDVDGEDAGPAPDMESIPKERNVWRISELIPIPQGDGLRAEPFPSGSHRDISVPVQKLIKSSQEGGVGKIPKPLAGGYEILLKNQYLSGSGEEHRAIRRMGSIFVKRQGPKDKELVEEPKYFINRPEEKVGNYPSFGERRPSGIHQLQKCPKKSPKDLRKRREVPRTIKEKPIGIDLTHKGTGYPNWSLQPWTVYSIWQELLWNSQPRSRKG